MRNFMKIIWGYTKYTSEELNVILRFPSWLAWSIAISHIPVNMIMFGIIQIWFKIHHDDFQEKLNEMIIDHLDEAE